MKIGTTLQIDMHERGMRIGDATLQMVDSPEREWINTLPHPFSSVHVSADKYFEVLMLDRNIHHEKFNPFCSMIFYVQVSNINQKETPYNTRGGKTYYIHQPMFKPTGTFSVDNGAQTMTCLDGLLHNASGDPAMISFMFGPAYYLHGQNYEPIEYFQMMEDQRKNRTEWFMYRYPEYDPKKYIEFMASVLGSKTNP